jgi:hypothetical protein
LDLTRIDANAIRGVVGVWRELRAGGGDDGRESVEEYKGDVVME